MADSLARQRSAKMLRSLLRISSELHEYSMHPVSQAERFLKGVCQLLGASCVVLFEHAEQHMDGTLDKPTWIVSVSEDRSKETHIDPSRDPAADTNAEEIMGSWISWCSSLTCTSRQGSAACRCKSCSKFRRRTYCTTTEDHVIFSFWNAQDSKQVVCMANVPARLATGGNQYRELTKLLESEFGWLFRRLSEFQLTLKVEMNLPPRLRQMLNWLLTKLSEKEIANRAGLSQYTVHEYTKQLYRIMCVTSRNELSSIS